LTLTFYLLPALATTLKIRKRKLAQTDSVSNSSSLALDSNALVDSIKALVSLFNSKISAVESTSLILLTTKSELSLLTLKAEAFRQFNFSVVSQALLTAIFYN
jgi:DNA polymerase III sliding clamp (beta) subunit (PCNA family)